MKYLYLTIHFMLTYSLCPKNGNQATRKQSVVFELDYKSAFSAADLLVCALEGAEQNGEELDVHTHAYNIMHAYVHGTCSSEVLANKPLRNDQFKIVLAIRNIEGSMKHQFI